MKKTAMLIMALAACLVFSGAAVADTIKDGTITYSPGHFLAGQPLKTGYDIFGYNYQAHLFNGSYANVYLGRDGFPPYEGDTEAYLAENPTAENHWTWPYRDVLLTMKWNDAWISNQDRGDDAGGTVPDGKLDRHYGYSSYIGSGAWETNHMSGSYEVEVNDKMKKAHWTYFVKIVAVPSDATKDADLIWHDADSVEIGPDIWGAFAEIQSVENDPFAGIHGKQYGSPCSPGFGRYGPE